MPKSSQKQSYLSSSTSEQGSRSSGLSKQANRENQKNINQMSNKSQERGNSTEGRKPMEKIGIRNQTNVNPAEEPNLNSKASIKLQKTTSPARGIKGDSPKDVNSRIPKPAAVTRTLKKTATVSLKSDVVDEKRNSLADEKRNSLPNKPQKTAGSLSTTTPVKDIEKPSITARETEYKTWSEAEMVVLKPVTPLNAMDSSIGAGEVLSAVSPVSSTPEFPHVNKDYDGNFIKDTVEKLKNIGTEYHNICSTTAMMVLSVIKRISGNIEDWKNNATIVNFMQIDAKHIESRMNENKNSFYNVLTVLESNLLFQTQKDNGLVQKAEEKRNYLQCKVDELEMKINEYKAKCDDLSNQESEIVRKLQIEKNSIEIEMKTKHIAEQQKCEKLERMIQHMELDSKCKIEIFEKSLQEYQSKINSSEDLNSKLKRENIQLENRLEETTKENLRINERLNELTSQTTTEKEKFQHEEKRRKQMINELAELKKNKLKYVEEVKELEALIEQKQENEDQLSSELSALKEEKCNWEKTIVSQQQRISELESQKTHTLAENEAVSNKLLAEKEGLLHKLREEIKTSKKDLLSSKEYSSKLEQKLKTIVEAQTRDNSKQQLEALSQERRGMEVALKEAYEYNSRIEQELDDARLEVEKMDKLIYEKDSLLKVRNELITFLQNDKSVQQQEIERAFSELDKYKQHYRKLQAEFKEKVGQLKSLQKELNRMESVLEKAKTEFKILEQQHNDQRTRLEIREVLHLLKEACKKHS